MGKVKKPQKQRYLVLSVLIIFECLLIVEHNVDEIMYSLI